MGMDKEAAIKQATKFVDEVIQEAEAEATQRKKDALEKQARTSCSTEPESTGINAILKRGTRLQTRARSFVTRLLTQLRICK